MGRSGHSRRRPEPRRAQWQVFAASARGAVHTGLDRPNQDAALYWPLDLPGGGVVVAVADGHGHDRHFRSADGSALAVSAACATAVRRLGRTGAPRTVREAETVVGTLAAEIVDAWAGAVTADLVARPYTAAELAALDHNDDGVLVPYGSTLLLAMCLPEVVITMQIGDGDILAISRDGTAYLPMPSPRFEGERTASLCLPQAEREFRHAALALADFSLLAVMLVTDGYGNSQASDDWHTIAGADIAAQARRFGVDWFAQQLDDWARLCASRSGAGDDTTIAMALEISAPAQIGRAHV